MRNVLVGVFSLVYVTLVTGQPSLVASDGILTFDASQISSGVLTFELDGVATTTVIQFSNVPSTGTYILQASAPIYEALRKQRLTLEAQRAELVEQITALQQQLAVTKVLYDAANAALEAQKETQQIIIQHPVVRIDGPTSAALTWRKNPLEE